MNKLTELRKNSGLSTEALCQLLGVSRMTLNNWATGRTAPGYVHFIKMSQVLSVPVMQLAKALGSEE